MKKLSLLNKSLSISLILVFFTNSIGYAKEPSILNTSTKCGEWKVEDTNSSNDQRIGIKLLQQAIENDCSGLFTLNNQTDTLLGGGYTLELKTVSDNASSKYLPYNVSVLIPGLNTEVQATPINISNQGKVNVQGDLSLGAFTIDLSFFLLKTGFALVDFSCLIPPEQLLLVAIRIAPILNNTAQLAFNGDLVGSKNELSGVINVFYEKAGDVFKDIGIECAIALGASIAKKPAAIAKILLSFITWVPVVIFDYLKYEGASASITLAYIPPVPLLSETIYLETSIPTIRSSIVLVNGQRYSVSVSGTYSFVDANYWRTAGIGKGQPKTSPVYPSPNRENYLVGSDAEFIFSYPNMDAAFIARVGNLPYRENHLFFSTDGGNSFEYIDPVDPNLSQTHSYIYQIIGQGYSLIVKLGDSYYGDNYGQFKIIITPQ